MAEAISSDLESNPKPQDTLQMAESTVSDLKSNSIPHVIYRCKKCRRIVAAEENIVSHERGKGETSFKWKKRSGEEPADCTSIFVEPMKWMEAGDFKYPTLHI